MPINESCLVKDAFVVDSKRIQSDKEFIKETKLFNNLLEYSGCEKIPTKPLIEDKQEYGILLLLYSLKNGKEYKRFLPESMIKEMIGPTTSDITHENLIFFAEQWKKRTTPVVVTILQDDSEGHEYNSAIDAAKNGNIKVTTIGHSKIKKKK